MAALAELVAAQQLVASGALPWHPSFFEMLTAMMFEYFASTGVELAVLEVGMGGRLDATNIAEPGALIGFAGPRVIEQTIRQKLPEGFKRSEFLLQHGMLDAVVHRRDLKTYIARAFDFMSPKAA